MRRFQEVTQEVPYPRLVDDPSEGTVPQRKSRNDWVTQVLDLLALSLLGLAVLTAAFAGYEATSWGAHSQLKYHEAASQLGHANQETLRATRMAVSGAMGGSTELGERLSAASTATEASATYLAEASAADQASSRFLLGAVFLTVVMFLTGAATVLRQAPLKGMLLGAAIGVYGACCLYMVFLPFTW